LRVLLPRGLPPRVRRRLLHPLPLRRRLEQRRHHHRERLVADPGTTAPALTGAHTGPWTRRRGEGGGGTAPARRGTARKGRENRHSGFGPGGSRAGTTESNLTHGNLRIGHTAVSG